MWLGMSLLSVMFAATFGGEVASRLSYVIPRENDVVTLECDGEAVAWILPGGETVAVREWALAADWDERLNAESPKTAKKSNGESASEPLRAEAADLETAEPKKRKVADPQNMVLTESESFQTEGADTISESSTESPNPKAEANSLSSRLLDSTALDPTEPMAIAEQPPSDPNAQSRRDAARVPNSDDLEISSRVLRIRRVSATHRGRYSCERADGLRLHFMIPYVGERFDTAKAVVLSAAVSVGFGLAFLLVVVLDRWCRASGTAAVGPGDLVWDEDGFFREPSPRKFGVIYSNAIGYDPPTPPPPHLQV